MVLAQAYSDAQHAATSHLAGGRVWLFLQTDDFVNDAASLKGAGGVFEEPPPWMPDGTVALWRDPLGSR